MSTWLTYRAFGMSRTRILFLVWMGVCCGCTESDSSSIDVSTLESVWAALYPESLQTRHSPESIQAQFQAAAMRQDAASAREYWQRFLTKFEPEDGYFEDAMHARLVEWARMELVRLDLREAADVDAEQAHIAEMRAQTE